MTRFPLRPRTPVPLRILFAAALLASSCALPPQNEEVPLTAELETARRPSPTERAAPPTERAAPAGPESGNEEAEPRLGAAQEAERDGGGGDGLEAGSASPGAPAIAGERGADESSSSSAARVDLEAIDRDVDAELPRPTEPSLAPQRVSAAPSAEEGTDDAAEDPGQLVAAELSAEERNEAVFETAEIETGDGRLMPYRVGGAGTPIILIHGWCGAGRQWQATAEKLAGNHRVFVVDLPGHGDSVVPVRVESRIPIFGRDIARLIESRELDEVVLVGHAMGAQVALETAAQLPRRVLAVIGVDALRTVNVDPDPELIEPYLDEFSNDFEASMRRFINQAVDPSTESSIREEILKDALEFGGDPVDLMRHFGEYTPKPALRLIDCRVVCINSYAGLTDVDGNRTLLPGFEVVYVEDVGHWPHLEKPDAFFEKLQRELRRIAPKPGDGAPSRILSMSPVIYCDDILEVRDFYVDGLAFEEEDRSPRDPARDPDFVALRRDGVTVILQASGTIQRDLPNIAAAPRDVPLFLLVSNLDRELARPVDFEIVVPERRLAGGARLVILKDPAGTLVYLQEPAGERTQR